MRFFNLPDLGEGLPDAEIVEWHVAEGDKVVADQPLVSVETAKAVVEVPSPRSGRIAKLYGQPGDIVNTGAPLVEFDEGTAARRDAGTVVGTVETGETVETETPERLRGTGTGVKVIPAVRALAKRLDVDLSIVTPSGPEGLITAADVERVARTLADVGPVEPMRGVRRAMAHNMSRAQAEVAPATLCEDADIDVWESGADLTIRLVQAIVAGCKAEPSLNAWYHSDVIGRRVLRRIDLGIAIDTEDGLFVPVLRDVAARDPDDLRRGLDAMKRDVGARTIPPEEMRGFSFILSNFGNLGGRYAAPIVQPPSVAILGAGRARPEPVVSGGEIVAHRILPLSLTFDHRAVTGGEAARFLATAITSLERRGG